MLIYVKGQRVRFLPTGLRSKSPAVIERIRSVRFVIAPVPAAGHCVRARDASCGQTELSLLKRNPDAPQVRGKFQPRPHAMQRDDDAFFILELHPAAAAHQRAADTDG